MQNPNTNLYYNKMIEGKPKRACTSISKHLFDLYSIHSGDESTARKKIATLLEIAPSIDTTISSFVSEHILSEIVRPDILKKHYLSLDQISLDLEGDSHKQTELLK